MFDILFRHPYILIFGILQIFFSAPGQTFLISLFVSHIFEEIGISLSLFAGLYSAATLIASLLLNPAGRLIDRYPVKNIIVAVTFLMACGCWILASAKDMFMLFAGFFILRLIGQGVFGLTGSTLIIKKFEKNRGKAMGIITLGFPFSEALYPVIALSLLELYGWRTSYVIFGISNLVLMLPVQLFLIRKSRLKKGHFLEGEALINPQTMFGQPDNRKVRKTRDFTLKQVMKDIKFYLILFAACVPPLVVTGLFFHQEALFKANLWPIGLAASGFGLYAVCKALGSVFIGPAVDRWGPLPFFIIIIMMLAGGTYLASLGGSRGMVYVYFGLIGASLGFSSPVMNVVWPYFYGVKHMGSIKGMIATFRNGLTSLGPLPMAMAIEGGLTINQVLLFMAIGIFLTALLPVVVWRMD